MKVLNIKMHPTVGDFIYEPRNKHMIRGCLNFMIINQYL